MAIRAGAGEERAGTGGLQAVGAVAAAQAHDAEAGAVALLGMGAVVEDGLDELPGHRAGRLRPPNQAGRTPFGMAQMRLRHVCRQGGVVAAHPIDRHSSWLQRAWPLAVRALLSLVAALGLASAA